MNIDFVGLRDRRIAGSDEVFSVASTDADPVNIYGAGTVARHVGSQRAQRVDRSPNRIKAIILHKTGGVSFLPPFSSFAPALPRTRTNRARMARRAYPLDDSNDDRVNSNHRIDKISAHFVILNDGTVFYTHDVEFILNNGGGRFGIDIEFAGRFSRSYRLSHRAIRSGRKLVQALKTSIPSITHIHPHGQVQKKDKQGVCGGTTGNRCGKHDSCPGPDIWVNVGKWATQPPLSLISETTSQGYQNNGISSAQSDPSYDQQVALQFDNDLGSMFGPI